MINDYYLERVIPTLDLHGLSRDIARSNLLEFIKENIKLKYKYIRIIHGIGEGILKEEVHNVLEKNKYVTSYKLENDNPGSTIVLLKRT